MTRTVRLAFLAAICFLSSLTYADQAAAPVAAGSVTETKVTANALKGNLLGDPTDVRVAVYVPPSYKSSPDRRYPTLYLLHGFTSDIAAYLRGYQGMQLGRTMDELEEFSHIRIGTRALSEELSERGIPHTFEVYADGTHESRIRQRIETRVLRFFAEVLAFPAT